jgi:hypothetical protein
MKPSKRKSLEGYIRLFSLFEKHLKEYHKVFDNDFYKITYIVQRERYSNDARIKVILTILRQPLWVLLISESQNLKSLLENYSRYFSVTDITIVRPFNLKPSKKLIKKPLFQPQTIEERVSFELFIKDSEWRPIE